MIDVNVNPMLISDSEPFGISFRQTRDTLTDTELYSRFIYNAENRFRKSRFYKAYKCNIMNRGLDRDQRRPGITSEMADLEMHHEFISLKNMAIMITEHYLNTYGSINTFQLVNELKRQHRLNRVSVIILSETEHQCHHDNPSDFISIKQCFSPHPFDFLYEFMDGMTLDIAFKLLLHLKQEEQFGGSNDTNMIIARNEILKWTYTNNI